MKKVFLGINKICFEYETLEQLREECKKYDVSIGHDVSILIRAKIPTKIKIDKIIHLANEYKYSVSGYIFENVKYIQLGCFTRTVEEWDVDFWNNDKEFLEGSEAGIKRLNAYKKMKMILDFEKDEK